ncbi:MAG TPA: cytochrome P450 [Acidimicrobiales bacterium]|nr:cytochrome P450 [Acidimicrobiales bacterium]
MTLDSATDVYYDPYRPDINVDPYPIYRRLRDEAPLYHNEPHDFFAVSRFEDVERCYRDKDTFSSARGAVLEIIRADFEMPPGVFIFEDPPLHTVHRGLVSRVFTPRRMASIEPQVRAYTERTLDPLVGGGGFDFVRDLGAQMPMRVIGMLLGIPEEEQEKVRDHVDAGLRTEEGQPMDTTEGFLSGDFFADYVEWRAKHPSDDLMTDLLNIEFEDDKGVTRKLAREEILTYVSIVAGAGNETTNRLIGWTGKVLADHPEQRRQLVEDPSLIPGAIEELLRFEPPAPHGARYVVRDVEIHGRVVPAGSVMLVLMGAANRDERQYEDPDVFDIHREPGPHLTFGLGIHFCLGAALARLEGRVALEEVLKRFPEWEVDWSGARLASTSTVRGWDALPVTTGEAP